jgi:hypothetical protein
MAYYDNKLINHIDLYNFYKRYKNIITAERSANDALYIIDQLKITPIQKGLLLNLVSNTNYHKILDNKELFDSLKEIDKLLYKEEAYEYINQLMRRTSDLAQIKCLTRKSNLKPLKPQYISIKELIDKPYKTIEKHCPYCRHIYKGTYTTEYVICGYGENGFDWTGCGRDWCFKCDKYLCKTWEYDQLFLQENRVHNKDCCNKHSIANNRKYYYDYCQCSNDYVKRDKNFNRSY